VNIFQAIILGIIQGLTEFLPISSTAHLRIVPALFSWDDPGAAFTAVIQIGTLVAVLVYFARDIRRITGAMLKGIAGGRPFGSRDAWLGWMIGLGTIPIVVCGLLFKEAIETTLRSLYVISASMIALALILMLAEMLNKLRERRGMQLKDSTELKWWEVLLVGFAQAVALIPGSSRSGTTISGGLLVGMSREEAARFSFLLSLPSVFAAGVFELVKEREALLSSDAGLVNLIVSTVVSAVVGYASIAFLLGYLKKHTTYLFIVYRIVVGVLLLVLLGAGVLLPD
jgi:undecaprenyl-diphosphatase